MDVLLLRTMGLGTNLMCTKQKSVIKGRKCLAVWGAGAIPSDLLCEGDSFHLLTHRSADFAHSDVRKYVCTFLVHDQCWFFTFFSCKPLLIGPFSGRNVRWHYSFCKEDRYKIKIFRISSDSEEVSWRRNVLIHEQTWNSIFLSQW